MTKNIVEIIGVSYQKIFDRGLMAYGLEGKIKDPRVLIRIKQRQDLLLEELEAEKMVHEMITKFINNHEGVEEEVVSQASDETCRYCGKQMIKDPKVGTYCTCHKWFLKNR